MQGDVTVAWALCASPFHKGPRWLRSVYFYRHPRHKSGLQSYCTTCTKIHMRKENLSEATKVKRNEYSRRYKERKRREAGVPVRTLHNPRFDHAKLSAYLARYLVLTAADDRTRSLLNGKKLDQADNDFLRHMRLNALKGTGAKTSLRRVDTLASKYDLDLWEIEQAAGGYKRDIRTSRRRRSNNAGSSNSAHP